VVVSTNASGTTAQAGDVLNGGLGTDQLNLSITGANAGATTTTAVNAVSLSGIEKVSVLNFQTLAMTGGTFATTIDASLFDSSLSTLALGASSSTATLGDTSFANVQKIVNAEMGQGKGSLNVGIVATATAGTADAMSLTLANQTGGTFTAAGIETLNVVSNTSANTVTLAAGFKTVNVSGAFKATLGVLDSAVTTLNAATSTGGVVATVGVATITVTGGTGADTITSGTNLSTGSVNAGDGIDTLVSTADAVILIAADGAKYTNFETFSVSNVTPIATANRSQDMSLLSGITTLNVTQARVHDAAAADTTQNATFTKLSASTNTLNITALANNDTDVADDLTVTVSAVRLTNTTADAMTVNLGTSTAGAGANQAATGTGVLGSVILNVSLADEETITINSLGASNQIATLTNTAGKVVNIAGSKNLIINSMTSAVMTTLDANTMTGDLNIVASSNAVASTITGGSGNDSLIGGTKADVISGGAGNDQITGAAGSDNLSGGAGDDTFVVATASHFQTLAAAETVDGGTGNDTISFTADMTLIGSDLAAVKNVENLTFASAGANSITLTDAFFTNGAITTIVIKDTEATAALTVDATALTAANSVQITANVGGAINDSLVGGAGNDTFTVSTATSATALTATDTVTGGAGTDTLAITLATNALTTVTLTGVTNIEVITVKDGGVNLAAAITSGNGVFVTTTTGTIQTTVGNVDGSGMTGGGALTFNGSGETDSTMSITGGAGGDILTGGSKADTIIGGAGTDAINGGAGADSLSGGDGVDTFTVSTLTDFVSLATVETVSGGAGNDILTFTEAATTVVNSTDLTAISSIETITFAGTGTSSIILTDAVYTANGAATLAITDSEATAALTVNASALSAANSVQVTGSLGADGAGQRDNLTGGSGNDTFSFSTATSATALAAGDTIIGGAGTDTLAITTATNALTSVTFANVSGLEAITMTGDAAVTLVLGDLVFGTVVGATVNASAITAGGVDVNASGEALSTISMTGSAVADTLTGGAKADTISGGVGVDLITGGLGADSLTGGIGADIFVYALVTESNASNTDTITDFTVGADKLRVTLDYALLTTALDINATVQTARAGTALIQDNLSGARGQATYDTTGSALYINFNNDNLLTTADYKININAASTATASIVDGDINFIVNGGTNADVITTGGGADTINMGQGDSVNGGAGVDTFAFAAVSTASTITGGTGADLVTLFAGANTLTVGDTDGITITTSTGIQTIAGTGIIAINAAAMPTEAMNLSGTGAFTVTGWASTGTLTDASTSAISVTLAARATGTLALGADTTGTDAVVGTALLDAQVVTMTGANDATVSLGLGDLSAATYTGVMTVTAGGADATGTNVIATGTANDTITAGGGVDNITGGAGDDTIILTETVSAADTVVFADTLANNGVDTITAFATTVDKINLDAMTTTTAYVTGAGATQNVFTTGTQAVTIAAGKLYVVTTATVGGADSAAAAATAISAGAAWTNATNGEFAYFVVVDNNSSAVYSMLEAGGVEVVTAELTLMGTIDAVLVTGDIVIA